MSGYARVSTRDQNLALQVDALKAAGCSKVLTEIASGASAERPVPVHLLDDVRPGDVIVIWKLDRLGRSLRHLIDVVGALFARDVGLRSLNDPVDTTTAQGRLVFNLFASLAEFERDVIRERTQAGLSSARARGRKGGRPKGLPEKAEPTAYAAETLYREGTLSAEQIAQRLHISKSTLYAYLRHRGVPWVYGRPPGETGRPVPRKTIPAESLIDLTRQLAALPARSHERRLAVAEAARGYGVSEPTVYRALAERCRPKGLRRVDRGTPRVLPPDQMERYCELIAAIKTRTSNKKGRHLSTAESIRLLEKFGIETPEGLVRAPAGTLNKTTVNRYLRQWGYDRTTLGRAPPAVRFQPEHSNDCWQFDLSPSDLKYVEAPSWVRADQKAPTLMLFSVVDDRSGVAYQEYRCVYGEDVVAALRFLFNAMSAKASSDLPLQGIPRMLYADNGPVTRSQVFQRVMRYLGVEVRTHLPAGKDERQRYRARATGKVERPFRTVKEVHETLYHFQKPQDETEANAWLHNFLIRYNAMDHRSGERSRIEDWLQHLPADGVRAVCSWERFCTFAREPEQRKVAVDARVAIDGIRYEVDPDLAGEDVVLWWGLFDQELFVEHGDKRYGPYLPVDGPIPLNRYRAFRKTAAQTRSERIEALAAQLGLPREALESRPDVAVLVQPVEIPVQAFADPDPFRQLAYASPLEAKRAIAQYLGRALATLPADQLEAINVVVSTTLNKQEVLAQVRACVAQSPEALPDAE